MRKGLGRHNYRSAGGPVPSSLVLDFAGTGTLDPRVTFTRSTTATYYNSSGVLSTAPINAPRFDFNPTTGESLGLLIEQSSTNLLTYSNDFTNAAWTKTGITITPNAAISPDGTTNASAFTTNGVTPTYAYILQSTNIVSGVLDVYAKANTARYLVIVRGTYDSGDYAIYDLVNGTVTQQPTFSGSTASITLVNNGYYRCFLNSAQTTPASGIVGFSVSGAATGLTTGTSGNLYIYGSQFEALAFPTSYIPTTSAQVTRAADNVSMTGTNFSSWFNASQSSLYMDFDIGYYVSGSGGNNQGLACFGTSTNRILTYVGNGASRPITGQLYDGTTNTNIVLNTGGNLTTNTSVKVAFAFNTTTLTGTYNGLATNTATGGNLNLSLNIMYLGYKFDTSTYLNGHIRKFAYYPTAVTSAQLQALTGS